MGDIMRLSKRVFKLIIVILIALQFSSCVVYSPYKIQKNEIPRLYQRNIRVIYEGEEKNKYYITKAKLKKKVVTGSMKEYYIKPKIKKDKFMINFHMKENVAPPDSMGKVSIPLKDIRKIQVYEVDPALTLIKTVLLTGLSVAAISVIIIAIVLATKESCPFVYTFDGEKYTLTGEIYSGAILPHLERHDYLPLPDLHPVDGKYQLKMDNQMREIQSTNLTELVVVDHPENRSVLIDKYGDYQTFGELQKPIAALTAQGNDILPIITDKDSLYYSGEENQVMEENAKDSMVLTFKKPQDANTAKLVYKGKNSFWLDYTMGRFFSLFGERYHKWFDKQKESGKSDNPNWSLEQDIPLSIYVKQDGKWEFADYYHVVGPMADKEMVLPIDISKVEGDEIEVKLESGFMFWETDYVGIDYTENVEVKPQIVSLESAIDHDNNDVRDLLLNDDNDYFVMPEIGNRAIMQFPVPEQDESLARSIIMHSKGHYEVIREPDGPAKITKLNGFKKPGRLSRFSYENLLEMRESFNNE